VLTERIRALIATEAVDRVDTTASAVTEPKPRRMTPRTAQDPRSPRAGDTGGGASELIKAILARERLQRRLLVAADSLAALAAVSLAALFTHAQLMWSTALVILVVVIIAKLQGLYDRDELVIRKSTLQETPKLLVVAAATGVIVYFARDELLGGHSGTPAFFFLIALLISVLLPVGRMCARRIACSVVAAERCLVVGDAAVFRRLQQRMVGVKGTTLVGVVPTDEVPMSVSELQELASRLDAHRLIIAPEPRVLDDRTADLISCARAAGLRVSLLPGITAALVPGVMAAIGAGRAVDQFGGYTIVGVPHFGLSRSSAAIKRVFDVLSAVVAMVAFAPVMLMAALWIKLDSPGPVLFRQTRVGRDGRRFNILKLRSMVDGADAMKLELLSLNEAGNGMFKIAADPRVTRSGFWLRRIQADELPQLFNVLRGEMSLVGPRPLVVEEDERIVGRDRRRLHLMPGMTGPWQILGPNSHSLPIGEMAKLDYMYVANWSLWEDMSILLRTIALVVGRRGV
jgi:exopolysaccharide biosynthesis polyprenyl glycosylphosphotransferase